jgi:hypothetical protein
VRLCIRLAKTLIALARFHDLRYVQPGPTRRSAYSSEELFKIDQPPTSLNLYPPMILVGERAVDAGCPCVAARIRLAEGQDRVATKGIREVQLCHPFLRSSARFDEATLVSAGGPVPVVSLAERAVLGRLGDECLTVPRNKGAHAGGEGDRPGCGMVAGADSIQDMDLVRHGGIGRLFTGLYAPSTLGSFLRSFSFGHVRQLAAVAARLLVNLARQTPLLPDAAQIAHLDVNDTIRATYGYAKQGAGYGYSGVKGLNALLARAVLPERRAGDRGHPVRTIARC